MAAQLGFGPSPKPSPPKAVEAKAGEALPFGFIANAIRRGIDKYGRAPNKLGIATIVRHTQEFSAPHTLTSRQIRAALKGLTKNKEIERLGRGLYRAGHKLVVPE